MTDEAIRCSKDLVHDYPKSTYALDAAFSIPVAYANAKKWEDAAKEYHFFIKNYTEDKEKLIAAYIGAARAYMELKEEDKAVADYDQTLKNYDKYGLQIKNADPGVPAEAAFYLGEHEYNKMDPYVLKGKEKEKAATIKKLVEILQAAMGHYSKSASYASEKWTFRATNKMGMLFVVMASKVREQEKSAKGEEEMFAERITIVQQLPPYYDQARPIFQKNIDLARDQGFYNQDVVQAEEGYIEMYYQQCAVFAEVADAFANAPLPDSAAIVKEYVEYVFKNYLSNAVQNADGGTEISVSLKLHHDAVRLCIENRGSSIPDDMKDKIWTEAFTTSPEGAESTGLGLYIVKEISLMEHTECGFDNTDTGVRFWFDFIDCPDIND